MVRAAEHLYSWQRLNNLGGADAAGGYTDESVGGVDEEKSLIVYTGCYAIAGLRTVHFNLAAAHPGRGFFDAPGNG